MLFAPAMTVKPSVQFKVLFCHSYRGVPVPVAPTVSNKIPGSPFKIQMVWSVPIIPPVHCAKLWIVISKPAIIRNIEM